MFTALFTLSTVVSVAYAQSSNSQLELQSIDAQFDNARIVPDLIPSFDPVANMNVKYGGTDVVAGSPLAVDALQVQPEITVTPANSSTTLPNTFTLVLADPGALGGDFSAGPTRHWLANGVTLGDNGTLVIPGEGAAITPYGAPFPPETDSAHRYVFLLYEQPDTFNPQGELATPGQPIAAFNLIDYATTSGLGSIVAGTYFTTARGTVAPVSTTSAVITSTLPAAQAAGGASSSGTRSGSASTGSPTSSTAAGVANIASVGTAGLVAALVGALFA